MSRYRRDAPVLLAYFLLTLVLTYPLILNITTHVAGDGSDDPALAWNLWWVPHALLDLGQNPIYTDYIFFPIGLNLGFYTLTYLNAFFAVPFQFAFGLVPAANLNLILSFTLSGFGAYLLVQYLLRRTEFGTTTITASAFAAGLVYAFSSNKFLYASLGQFNIASSQWIPFYILFLLKNFDTPRPPLRYGVLLGFFLLAQALSEFIFASFLILFTLAYMAYRVLRIAYRQSRRANRVSHGADRVTPIANRQSHVIEDASRVAEQKSEILNLLLAALLFLAAMSPILAAMFSDLLTEGDFIQQGLGFSNIFSADVFGFLVPSHLHPLMGFLDARFAFPYINFMYLGFAALALALVALWKVRPARIWGVWFALIALVTLGPTLRFNGAELDLPLPFDLLLEIPLVKGNRYPSRWSVILTLCLAVLVGYGMAWVLEQVSKRQAAGGRIGRYLLPTAFCLLLIFEHLSIPLPLSDFRVPEIYAQIAQEEGNFSVMELPLAWRNGFRVTGSYRRDSQTLPDGIFMLAQWYQTTQQHPILNGNTSRNPELKFQYFSETTVLNSLIAIQTGHEIDARTRARDKELTPRLLQFFGTRYVIWHTPVQAENREVADRTRAYIEDTFPVTKVSESYENGLGIAVYRVNDAPPSDSLTLKPNDPLARLYFGEGWGPVGGEQIYAQRTAARFFFPLATPRDMQLSLENFMSYPSFGQGLALRVNGKQVSNYNPIPITNGTFTATLPAVALQSGMNEIEFAFDKTLPLAQLPDPPLSIVVRSAGEEQGAFGHIYVNGVDESPNARGYNVVVIEPRTGKVQGRANFDTFARTSESARMAQFIDDAADWDLVAVAASDDASLQLTEQGVDALRRIGAREDLRGKFRWSHAVLGVKSAPIGSALELASATKVSQVLFNAPFNASEIAASIGEIRIEPAP